MSITVFRDDQSASIIIRAGQLGAWPIRSKQAHGNQDGTIDVHDVARSTDADTFRDLYAIPFGDFVDENGDSYGSTEEAVVDALNSVFFPVGPLSSVFVLTSSDTLDFSIDPTGTTVLFDNGDSYAVNAIKAVGAPDGTISIYEHGPNGRLLYSDLLISNATAAGGALSPGLNDAVNELNALFTHNGLALLGVGSYNVDLTGTVASLNLDSYAVDPVGPDVYGSTTTNYHRGRAWSTETISEQGEYFKFTVRNEGIIGMGLYDAADMTKVDATYTASDNGAAGYSWSMWFHPTPDGPWTVYQNGTTGWNSGSYVMGPGWTNATKGFRFNPEGASWLAGDPVVIRVGIDANSFAHLDYYDESEEDWVMVARSTNPVPEGTELGFMVKSADTVVRLASTPTVHEQVTGTELNYRYIESPDGTFYYPLFATAEEANEVDVINGGAGTSHAHVFVDDPTAATWYMPDNGQSNGVGVAPVNTADIVYTQIMTEADALHVPAAFSDASVSVDEGSAVNVQVEPAGMLSWSTSVSNLPSGLSYSNGTIQGTAPEVTGDNVNNPSDDYVISVIRTNAYGSSTGYLTLTVANLTAPTVAVSGFTWDATSTPLVDSDTMADGSVVTFDDTVEAAKRFVLPASWVEAYVLPALSAADDGDAVYVGVKDGAGVLTDGITDADWDGYIKWEKAGTGHISTIYADGDTPDAITVNSLTSSVYDYAFEADDHGDLYVIACNINDIMTQPGVDYGGQFGRVVETTGTAPFTLSMVTEGMEMDFAEGTAIEVVIPKAERWIQVTHDPGHILRFDGSLTMPTLNAGYTYRFLVADVEWADQTTATSLGSDDILKFTADGATEYTTGITRSGAVGSAFAYVEFAVPSDVPPLQWYNDAHETPATATGVVTISGSTHVVPVTGITLEGPVANQTGTNVMDQNDHGWISLDEQLSAGERLVLDNAFFADFMAEAVGTNTIFAIGLKGDNWTNTKEVSNAQAANSGEFFKGDAYLVGVCNNLGTGVEFRVVVGPSTGSNMGTIPSTYGTVCAFLEVTSDGNNIRLGFGRNGNLGVSQGDESTVAYADWSSYKGETGDQGYGITSKDLVMSFWTFDGDAIDGANIDWTQLSEVAVPTPAATLTTSWTKALDFSGGSEHVSRNYSSSTYAPIQMGQLGATTSVATTAGQTNGDTNSRPWATACVFVSDGNASNQHIWNEGEGAGSTDDNIYLRTSASGELYFGWGRDGALNECFLGLVGAGTWTGVYIAHTGARLSGANATAANLAAEFDIRLVNLSSGAVGSNLSVAGNWTTTGGGMDRAIAGNFTVGGRGTNRNFSGKVASMVVTTMPKAVAMPTDAEISMMVRDPMQWETDYKVGNAWRASAGSGNVGYVYGSQSTKTAESYATHIWLMGDGAGDAYSSMKNQVYSSKIETYLIMQNMVSSDIETVNISGLT